MTRETLRTEWDLFRLAVQFLTRLPVPGEVPFSDDLQVRSAKYYPLVGVLVGLTGAAVLWIGTLWFPPVVAVLLALAAMLLVTGAFHEDGLADAFDGLLGGLTRERALEIMRDSSIGTYGALALAVVMALKVAALSAMPPWVAGVTLIAAEGLGRMAIVHVIHTTRYARERSTKFAVPHVTPDGYRWALVTAFLILILLVLAIGPGAALLGIGLCIGLAQVFRLWFMARLGGYTGDCLGGSQQVGALGVILGVLAWL